MQPMIMNYLNLLEFSYTNALIQDDCPPASRLAFIASAVFDFTTYEDEIAAVFAAKGIEVCNAISKRQTFEYIKTVENHYWYLLLLNTPFFMNRIEWGTSIRGAWWRSTLPPLNSHQLYSWTDQLLEIQFKDMDWLEFIAAITQFTKDETTCTCPSGDGSLRWPCPVHPPAAQPAVQKDAVDTERMSKLLQCCTEFSVKYHPDQRPRQMTMVFRDSVENSAGFREELGKAIDQFNPIAITTQEEA